MLQYPQKIPIDVTLRYMAWRNAKNFNQILHFRNVWVKGFKTVYRLSRSVDILEEALKLKSKPCKKSNPSVSSNKSCCCWVFMYAESESYLYFGLALFHHGVLTSKTKNCCFWQGLDFFHVTTRKYEMYHCDATRNKWKPCSFHIWLFVDRYIKIEDQLRFWHLCCLRKVPHSNDVMHDFCQLCSQLVSISNIKR